MEKIAAIVHCPQCGSKYPVDTGNLTEILCESCEHTCFFNRTSVSVLLIPNEDRSGLWIGKRGINPGIGKWCLPCGYSARGETWRMTATRETLEELQITIIEPEKNVRILDVHTVSHNSIDLLFCIANPLVVTVNHFKQTREVIARALLLKERFAEYTIAFPLHKEIIERFFNGEFAF